jgi:hypothetical protein
VSDGTTLGLRAQDLDWREIGNEIVALDGRDARYLAVKGSGALLWRMLADSTTWEGLVEALVDTYGIDFTRAQADVDAFLARLTEHRLLVS